MDRPSRTKQTPKILNDMIFQEDMDALLFLVCSLCLIVLEKNNAKTANFIQCKPSFFGIFALLLTQNMYLLACINSKLFACVSLCYFLLCN